MNLLILKRINYPKQIIFTKYLNEKGLILRS